MKKVPRTSFYLAKVTNRVNSLVEYADKEDILKTWTQNNLTRLIEDPAFWEAEHSTIRYFLERGKLDQVLSLNKVLHELNNSKIIEYELDMLIHVLQDKRLSDDQKETLKPVFATLEQITAEGHNSQIEEYLGEARNIIGDFTNDESI